MILSRWLRTLFLGRQRTTAPSTAFYGLSKSIEAGAWTDPRRNQGHYEFRTLFRRTSMWWCVVKSGHSDSGPAKRPP
jgi:hypothetical protein